MKKISLYCDGSSLGNPGFGGWCAILKYQDSLRILSGAVKNTTNNRMELTAVIEGIKGVKYPCEIIVYSDSRYVCEGINKWLNNWIKNGFNKVKNLDLWEEYIVAAKKHKVEAIWIKGHTGHIENEQCDTIARNEATKLKNGISKESYTESIKQIDKEILQNNKLEVFQNIINYHFNDESLLIEALTHKSYNKTKNNERLEFLGDAVLDLIVGEYVYHKLSKSNEGDLTKMRASIVNEAGFAKLAKLIDLGAFLLLSQSEENNKGREKPSILSNAFEALMGAIYLDGSITKVRELSYELIEKEYKDISLESLFKDFKTMLQELTQSIFGAIPQYDLINSSGPDHNKEFVMSVKINGDEQARASGKSKKEAEQNCAKKALYKLRQQQIINDYHKEEI